jgi:hypothetical protein
MVMPSYSIPPGTRRGRSPANERNKGGVAEPVVARESSRCLVSRARARAQREPHQVCHAMRERLPVSPAGVPPKPHRPSGICTIKQSYKWISPLSPATQRPQATSYALSKSDTHLWVSNKAQVHLASKRSLRISARRPRPSQ